jgi:hypothetical protein
VPGNVAAAGKPAKVRPHKYVNKDPSSYGPSSCDVCGLPPVAPVHMIGDGEMTDPGVLLWNETLARLSDSSRRHADGSGVDALRVLHDRLLAERPDGAAHDEDACPLCGADDNTKGGWMATFSEDELQAAIDAAVAEATAPLTSRIAELENSAQQSELEQVKSEMEARIAELETKLDAAVLEATTAKDETATLQQAWDDEKAAAEEAVAVAARREERIQKVKELASFPAEYLEQNGDRFAAMSEEDFNARLEEWAAISKPPTSSTVPTKTALIASRQEDEMSALSCLREFREPLTDPRTL